MGSAMRRLVALKDGWYATIQSPVLMPSRFGDTGQEERATSAGMVEFGL